MYVDSKKPLKYISEERGVSMVMVLFALIIVSIIGVSMIGVAGNNLTQSTGEQESQSSFYVAEGGATKILADLKEKAETLASTSTTPEAFYTAFEDDLFSNKVVETYTVNRGEQPIANVKIERLTTTDPRQYKIISIGKVGDRHRQVSGVFTVDFKSGSGFAIPTNLSLYTEETIELTGGAEISGKVATNLQTAGSIKLDGGAGISDQILVPVGSSANPISAPPYLLTEHISKLANFNEVLMPHKLPPFPTYPTYPFMADTVVGDQYNPFKVIDSGNLNITQWQTQSYSLNLNSNVSFRDINVSQNNTLTIKIGRNDRQIVVDNLNLTNGTINIEGTGKLTIYVKKNMAYGSGSFNKNGNKSKLEIYLKGTTTNAAKKSIEISANMLINGSLYAENANLIFTGGGGFLGHVLTGGDSVVISGGARVGDSVILAPRAKVQLLAGGKMQGAVISKSYYADGGTELKYVPINHSSIPSVTEIGGSKQDVELESQPIRES